MSAPIDATLREGERDSLLAEVQKELPLWLARAAVPAEDPLGELADLLRFDPTDLRRVVSVHTCTDPIAQRFAATLAGALRAPAPSTARPREEGTAVRGPIDWPATTQLHVVGQVGTYVTRPRRRTFDTPEHRALRWTIRKLDQTVASASMRPSDGAGDNDAETVVDAVDRLRRALRRSHRVEWLRDVPAELPSPRTRQRLQRSRNAWVRTVLASTVELLLQQRHLDPDQLAAILRKRYFVPGRDWLLHEVVVLVRLDRALCEANVDQVRRTLFSDSGIVAVYRVGDGAEVRIRQQGWPEKSGIASRRQSAAKRHGFDVHPSRPDLMVERGGQNPDLVVLELKASRVPATLGSGLSQLLGYLHERPGLFDRQPAGWLVPLPWERLTDAAPDSGQPLWVVPADRVAAAVVERFVSAGESLAATEEPNG
jgi:hypothetical protein